jgi:hypothetical protein
MEYALHGVTTDAELDLDESDEPVEPCDEKEERIVYLVEGDWVGHGRRAAWDAAQR